MSSAQAPSQIRVSRDRRTLTLVAADGREHAFPAEMLRVLSPSAEVQGHSPEQRVTVGGKKDVTINDILPIGHYAIRIVFSDGHDSGLFTWIYLAEMAQRHDEMWAGYLGDLAARKLTR